MKDKDMTEFARERAKLYEIKEKKKTFFLYVVIERLYRKFDLWLYHKWFSLKYPVSSTDSVEWLGAYSIYLKECTRMRDYINSL